MANKAPRQSNLELLRIVAMFMVMILHANFMSLDLFHVDKLNNIIKEHPLSGFTHLLIQSFALPCVNLFILISGYFGIKLTMKGVLNFLFTITFFSLFVIVVIALLGIKPITISFLGANLLNTYDLLGDEMWFIGAYIALMFISPLLNSFVEQASRRKLLSWLLLFYAGQVILDWALLPAPHINQGLYHGGLNYISFVGLYLLGRYLRLYPLRPNKTNHQILSWIGFALAIIAPIIIFYLLPELPQRVLIFMFSRYTSPHTMLLTISIFLLFLRIKLQSRVINWIAISSFSVYLVHMARSILPFFMKSIQWLQTNIESPILFLCTTFAYLCLIFGVCILLDKVRIWCWEHFGIHLSDRIEQMFWRLYQKL